MSAASDGIAGAVKLGGSVAKVEIGTFAQQQFEAG
jgi:hypothetical protein